MKNIKTSVCSPCGNYIAICNKNKPAENNEEYTKKKRKNKPIAVCVCVIIY